jgi:small subunit ribosomal protein S16
MIQISTPAVIDLDVDKVVTWLQNGAQLTDTAKAILSYVELSLNHLAGGVQQLLTGRASSSQILPLWLEEAQQGNLRRRFNKKSSSRCAKVLCWKQCQVNEARISVLSVVEEVVNSEVAEAEVVSKH